MQNVAEFRIIGRVGKVEIKDKVAFLDVAANYSRKVDDQWEDDPHWHRLTLFGKNVERAKKIGKSDLLHVTGRVRQSSFERECVREYRVDLIAERFAVLVRSGGPADRDYEAD
ncbi:single-stranded DNA-binding protein [Novosphingobium sp. PP1Y]|uniref:single-stranded DNA-binding protein n=1 Tax=Novosphingobium sp. PP1Y TaxID=702113 RepID=UPI00020EEE60|nr:single-stranded DNA-binding protein [Novosphingobium sp. PP1Y]CCA89768.1 putative single-strand binding protein/primosomal replication protein [Novosphingobium sp. PP1Y]